MSQKTVLLHIDGVWRSGSDEQTLPVINPATEEHICDVACASKSDLDEALMSSDRAFTSWKDVPPGKRAAVVFRAADLIEERKSAIARIMTAENGKSIAEAEGEVQFCADASRWYAEEAKRAYGRVIPSHAKDIQQITLREPVGPALGFAAWNFPAGNIALKIAAALSAGCSIIIKPSDETPESPAEIVRCFVDAGIPKGLLNLVFGDPAPISKHLIASPIPRKVSLTGSTPVGKLLQKLAADTMKRCTLELGGHAPVIVFSDAHIDKTVDALICAKFRNAGQVCTSPTRLYVHEDILDIVVEKFVERATQIKVGDCSDPANLMGPMITEQRRQAVHSLVSEAIAQGATLCCGGAPIPGKGYFYAPTVLRDVPRDARIMHEEPFGPVASFLSFNDTDAVIANANASRFGLAAYIFTESGSLSRRASKALNAGVVGVNHMSVHEAETPFGGVNESGYGSESGMEGLAAYLRTKMVSEKFG